MMKKLLTCLLAVAMLASMLTFGAAAQEIPEGTPIMDVPFGTPSIDGEMDDLYKKSGVIVSETSEATTSKVEARMAYDSDYFYVYCQVWDDTLDVTNKLPEGVKDPTVGCDSVEFYFYFYDALKTDWTKATATDDLGSGRVRFHSPTICPDYASRAYPELHATNKIGMGAIKGEVGEMVSRKMTYDAAGKANGFIVEYAIQIMPAYKAVMQAGTIAGFGFQYNDEMDGDGVRNTNLKSANRIFTGPRADPIKLLAKEIVPETTKASETTKAPVTTSAPVTTKAPESTPSTGDTSMMFMVMCGMAMLVVCTVVGRKNKAK